MKEAKVIDRLYRLVKRERLDLVRAERSWFALQANLRHVTAYRNEIAHSWPTDSFFQRVKWQEGTATNIVTSPEELAAMTDLATQLISQLHFLPIYLRPRHDLGEG